MSCLGSRKPAWLLASITCFVLALLAKEAAFSLPLVVALIAWWRAKMRNEPASLRRTIVLTLPYIAIDVVLIIFRIVMFGNNLLGDQGPHGNLAVTNIVKNIATYIGLLVIPF